MTDMEIVSMREGNIGLKEPTSGISQALAERAATRVVNVTAAIATLDRPSALARCLDALLSSDVLPAEVIIVDQSQDDATEALVAQRQTSSMLIVYIRQQRRGLSVSRNTAVVHASCPIVAITDDDCVPGPGWIAAIDRTFASPTAPDAVTGRVVPLGPDVPGMFVVAARESTMGAEFGTKVVPWIIGSGNNFAVKREWFNRIGGCDERLGVGSPGKAAEDMDFFYHLLHAGAHIRYEPDALIYHERQSKAQRIASRWSYGYGMGAFCSIWLRRGDLYATRILGHWLVWQCGALVAAVGQRQWLNAYQRWLGVKGTIGGLAYGLRVRSAA